MKSLSVFATLSVISFSLCACQPKMFGVPQEQWNQLSHEQQIQVIEGYNQRKMIETQNKPYVDAINTLGDLANNNAHRNSFQRRHYQHNSDWN